MTYEKVLFPTDFSDFTQTLECIIDIPGIKEIVILHVIDAIHASVHGWVYEKMIGEAKIRLDEQKQYLKSLGLVVKMKVNVITSSNITNEILKITHDENVSLIVMNSRGKSFINRLLLGSTSLDVVRYATTDVLIMRHKKNLEGEIIEKRKIFSRVLYPTDFSKSSENALSILKSLNVQNIILMHVITKGETKEEIDTNVQNAKKSIVAIKDTWNLNNNVHIRIGNPAEEISSVAEDEDVSLIAIPSHSKNWLKGLLLGDTASDVVKRAKRSVLIMKNK